MLKLKLVSDWILVLLGVYFYQPAKASQLIKTLYQLFSLKYQSNLTLKAISALAAITSSE